MPVRCTTRRVATTATAAVSALALGTAGAATASATGHSDGRPGGPRVVTLNDDVVAPYQLDLLHGHVLVGDGGTSTVDLVTSTGLRTLATGPQPGEVTGVAHNAAGELAYANTDYTTGETYLTVKRPGRSTLSVNLHAFEVTHNPDQRVHYGIDNPTQCQTDALAAAGLGPATYTGLVDSHPYAVASLGGGSWVVADAAGNDLLRVNRRGDISVLKVLPRQPYTITADLAASLGLPSCVNGAVYNFESVPTDVEVGPHGALYVTTLPGGPEDPSFGARGSVYRVNPATGHARRLATGFSGATNLAVTRTGRVFVAEFFAGQISTIDKGHAKPYLALPNVLSLKAGGGHLYAGVSAPMGENGPEGHGSIVEIR